MSHSLRQQAGRIDIEKKGGNSRKKRYFRGRSEKFFDDAHGVIIWWRTWQRVDEETCEAGSWNPEGKDSEYFGRMGMMAWSLMTLEVYFRHMPLYPR